MLRPSSILRAAAIAAAAFLVIGCAHKTPPPAAPRPGGVITVILPAEPASLNAMVVGGDRGVSRAVVAQMRWGLVGVDPDGTYSPLLAESVPTLANGLVTTDPFTVTYILGRDAVWSDGRPITAQDIVFTWRTIMDKHNKIAWRRGYELISSIDTPNAKTAVIHFVRPFSGYLDLFSAPAYGYVLPEHLLAGKDFNSVEASGPLASSGPFVLRRWDRGTAIVLGRNPKFWAAPAMPDQIVFKIASDERQAEQLFSSGAADVYAPNMEDAVLDGGVIARLRALPGVSVGVTASAVYEQMTFDVSKGQLADPLRRRAVAASLDRAAIASAALGPDGRPAEGIAGPVSSPGRPSGGYWASIAKPARAVRFVSPVTVVAPAPVAKADIAARRRELAEIARQLARAHIPAVTKMVSGDRLFATLLPNKRYQAAIWATLTQPTPGLASLFGFSGLPKLGPDLSGYRNPKATALVLAIDREPDPASRTRDLDALDRLLSRDLPIVPLFHRATVIAARANVHVRQPNPTIFGPFGNMATWWVGE